MLIGHLLYRGPWRNVLCNALSTPARIKKFKEPGEPGSPPPTLCLEHLLSVFTWEIMLQRGPTASISQDCDWPFFCQPLASMKRMGTWGWGCMGGADLHALGCELGHGGGYVSMGYMGDVLCMHCMGRRNCME